MSPAISFTVSKTDSARLDAIVARARALGCRRDPLEIRMDLCATHANGTPLDFQRLREFDDFSFLHDVFGIERHLDRTSGALRDMFVPRCTRKGGVS
jgi:hypothetical protein